MHLSNRHGPNPLDSFRGFSEAEVEGTIPEQFARIVSRHAGNVAIKSGDQDNRVPLALRREWSGCLRACRTRWS